MSNLILLIQSESDIAALPSAAESIVQHGYKGCWILVSPAIAVNAAEASAKYDKEINDLRAAELAAASRGDYTAAADHKLAREGKELERGTAVASAWKSVPEADRMNAIKNKLSPLMSVFPGKVNVKTNVLQDHYDPSQWIQMLNSLSGAWFKEFTPGSFSVAWPGAIPAIGVKIPIVNPSNLGLTTLDKTTPSVMNIKPPATEAAVKAFRAEKAKAAAKAPLVAATNPDERKKQLLGLRFFGLCGTAKKLGIDPKGKRGPQIIDEILAKEFAPATA